MSKQTAVEWLVDELLSGKPLMPSLTKQALEMEKQQIMDTYIDRMDCTNKELIRKIIGEQYYNDTFKK